MGGGGAAHGFQRPAEGGVLFGLLLTIDGAFDVGNQFLNFERLGQKVVGPEATGLQCHFQGCLAGEDNHLGIGPPLFHLRQQVQAVVVLQIDVQHNQIRRRISQGFSQRRAALRLRDVVIIPEHGAE